MGLILGWLVGHCTDLGTVYIGLSAVLDVLQVLNNPGTTVPGNCIESEAILMLTQPAWHVGAVLWPLYTYGRNLGSAFRKCE